MIKKLKLLLYCTKAKPRLISWLDYYKELVSKGGTVDDDDKNFSISTRRIDEISGYMQSHIVNGKIVAECDFEVEDLRIVDDDPLGAYWYETKTLSENEVLEKSCLTDDELYEYLGEDNEGYAIHIKNLHIFDEPKELSDYDDIWSIPLKKAPQNMMYAFELVSIKEEFKFNEYILISVRPEWLCKILNKEKTVEVRKKVLKEMLE